MKTDIQFTTQQRAQEETSIAEMIEEINETCGYCHPSTPLKCVSQCRLWKKKNELKELNQKMQNPNYLKNLMNTLKNKRRQRLLHIISERQHSATQLQQKMKKMGYYHSKRTILREYIKPLRIDGLVKKRRNHYYASIFGCKLDILLQSTNGILKMLPPHSECYEEKVIESLSKTPKTYQELEKVIPKESLSRVLKRLQQSKLIHKEKKNNYIFHFRTKRDAKKEKLSPTEKRIHKNIPGEGISTKELARKTNISLRRTYKYLKKLRGKKLTFKRRRPKKYTLSDEGMKTAELLEKIQALLIDFTQAFKEISKKSEETIEEKMVPDTEETQKELFSEILVKP
ncbi:MAG: hypothetical protein PVH12_01510 [Candidatus Bathyarchaeota archaeon]|jgi:sugar-specific transcriptional regulator TrmB